MCSWGAYLRVNVWAREWVWMNVCEYTCESMCLGADVYVDAWVREWSLPNVCESTCESVCCGCQCAYECVGS